MKISKKVYIDKDIPHYKWKLWKLRKGKKLDNIYCIIYKENSFLEIIKSNRIKDSDNQRILIGMATTKQGAIALLVRIFDEVYVPNPNIQNMKDYFITDNS